VLPADTPTGDDWARVPVIAYVVPLIAPPADPMTDSLRKYVWAEAAPQSSTIEINVTDVLLIAILR
jgi:hypothetical protein